MGQQEIIEPTLLGIGGSDPSGGAGIQADLKTITSISEIYGAAAITCLTVQNSTGVKDVLPLEPVFVSAQIRAVLTDHNVTHIKIGMVGSFETAAAIAEILSGFKGMTVYDPVLAATTGHPLFSTSIGGPAANPLLDRVRILTPNSHELEAICNTSLTSEEDAMRAAKNLFEIHPALEGVIVKGGHRDIDSSEITDTLVTRSAIIKNRRTRISNPHTHGTGCSFSSAFTAYHLKCADLMKAFELSCTYMDRLIRHGKRVVLVKNNQNGPLPHSWLNQSGAAD